MNSDSVIPNIPQLISAVAEWSASIILILSLKKRYSKKITFAIMGITLISQCFLQYLAANFTFFKIPFLYLYLVMLFNVFLMASYIYLIARINWKNVIFICCKALLIAEFMASLAWQLYTQYIKIYGKTNKIVESSVIVIIYCSVLLIVYLLEKRDTTILETININWKQNLIAIILTVLTFVTSNLGYFEKDFFLNIDKQYNMFTTRTLLDFCGYCILYLLQKLYVENQMKSELSAIQNTLNRQYKQYLDFKEVSDYIGQQCHDLKHQIETIRSSSSVDEREKYLLEMEQAVKLYQAWNVTENSTLDSILTQKKIYCAKHGIELTCTADGKELNRLAVRDICTIFGNILDNAIEAVSCYEEPERRVIHGAIYQKQSFLIIRFDNYFLGEIDFKDQLPITSKSDKKRHGYGLKSIKYAVEKYGGNILLTTENNWFIIKIMIPMKA